MIDQNALQGWMNFYKQNGLGPPQTEFTSPWGGVGLGMNPNQGAVQFAMRMAGQNQQPQFGMPGGQPPNFFAGFSQTPQGPVTIGENPYSARVNALFAAQNSPGVAPQMGNNYLARILK